MAEVLDFNKYRPPVLPLLLPGEGKRLNLIPPTLDLLEELRASRERLSVLLTQEDEEMVDALFELAARLMSCNRQLKKIKADYLRNVCGMDEADLGVFFQAYTNYLTDLENAKN